MGLGKLENLDTLVLGLEATRDRHVLFPKDCFKVLRDFFRFSIRTLSSPLSQYVFTYQIVLQFPLLIL